MSSEAEIRKRKIYRVTFVGFVVNLVLSLLKLAAGIAGRSGAMVADAVHSFSDLATDVVVIVFARISAKPRDDGHDYGHGKYETLATIIISLALGIVGAGILAGSIRAIRVVVDGGLLPRPGLIALVAAGVSIAVKEILYRYTVREGRAVDSPSVVANAWHHRSDALSSLGTLVGIACAYFLGQKWRIADPIAALVVAVFIFKVAFDLIRTGLDELLERSLPADVEEEILRIVTAFPEVREPHNLRTRRIGAAIAVEVHVRMDGAMTVARSHALTVDIERRLRARFGEGTMIAHSRGAAEIAGRPDGCRIPQWAVAQGISPRQVARVWRGVISPAASAGSPEVGFSFVAYGPFVARILFVSGRRNVPEYCRRSRKNLVFSEKVLILPS